MAPSQHRAESADGLICARWRAAWLPHQHSNRSGQKSSVVAATEDRFQADAEAAARTLLLRHLDPQQRAQLHAHGTFSVEIGERGTFYIFPRRAYNVVQMPKGDCYCCTPVTRVPISDLMLSQKLLLEADPEQFFKIANCKPHLIVDVPAASTRGGSET
jgi:hypothetical protein